jgi:hypothetical protein
MFTCSCCRVARVFSADHQRMASGKTASGASLTTGRHEDICGVLSKWREVFQDGVAPDSCTADMVAFVPPRPQTPARCGFFRSHLLVICAAKPRYTVVAAREHPRVLAPRLPTPCASVTSPLHTSREVLFEMCQHRVLLARIKSPASLPRESMLFIGTRFSNLYTTVDTPAEAA